MTPRLSKSPWSTDWRVMFHPAAAYQQLAEAPAAPGAWLAVRRPLLFAFVLGCAVSMTASGRLTLRLVVPTTAYGLLMALVEVLSLAVVREKTAMPFSRSLDLFFTGFGPWLLWLLPFATIWAFASPFDAYRWTGPEWDGYVAAAIAIWSAYIDFCFFRYVFRVPTRRAAANLVVQRAFSWTLAALIFGGGSLWSELVRKLGI